MQREIRCGGEFGFDDDRVHVSYWAGRAVPQLPLLNFQRERGAAVPIVEVDQEGMAAHDSPTGGATVREAVCPLADVLLIAEDLLLQARRLADSGAPTEAVEAILNDVTALREGGS